ncbi:isochorismate synthase [Ketobacter sp. MCCC 1A13808]|uniref:isochorismate synthase n=1 Tax=Ketobacter sp. MCCC 1A13808 TaxID=2602738 RepID=UPI000F1AE04A|nr:isochorismate synthase [Ketobacter sp. MCCC 1A13808]MVF11555.1 isochorismate synthase [Ketobacter sp. MCCC 1A13808]RLP53245.1 MAG: isochorismate synthase [Ketobacter sp.]
MNAGNNVLCDPYQASPSVDPRRPSDFIFMSTHQSIRASGIFDKITTPAVDGHLSGGVFQTSVNNTLQRAKQSGIEKPVIIGAIPFDVTQPSCLFVPRQYEYFERSAAAATDDAIHPRLQIKSQRSIPEEGRFKQGVKQAIANFQLSDIRKAVLSRVLELELTSQVDVERIFDLLVAQNPAGFNFRLPLNDGSELIGASPELLIRKAGEQLFSNPLAGSAKRQADPLDDRLASELLMCSGKDAHEHRLVIDEIQRALLPYCLELDVPVRPSLLSTPAMWHLSTFIQGQLASAETTALQLACSVHPTPAVCGYPTSLARKLINLVEPFERGLFTGMVGWCDDQGNGEWVVTIRCGTVKDSTISLFAGAGIVEESCPESEWRETQAKLQTMLRALDITQEAEA